MVLTLAENLDKGTEHMITLFKRMDNCHEYAFLGFLLEYGARVVKARPLPGKKMVLFQFNAALGIVNKHAQKGTVVVPLIDYHRSDAGRSRKGHPHKASLY